jgi:ATP-dependent Clp protease ATP-binding subunit ClpC
MFERFTERARKVLVCAQEEAGLLRHNFVGTEHLLLGLLRVEEGVAARALDGLGIHFADVRDKVAQAVPPGGEEVIGSPPFTPRAKKVLELSLREALQVGQGHIGTEHLLLGVAREGEGVGAQVLKDLGAPPERVREQVRALSSPPSPGEAVPGRAHSRWGPPYCPRCSASLAESARYRALEVAPGEPGGAALRAAVIYCSNCGTALSHSSPS